MAYVPIAAKTQTATISGIPANSYNRFLQEVEATSTIDMDFTSKLSPSGDFTKVIGISTLINSIRNLLTTPLGSYAFDPTYGSLLYEKVFSLADAETEQEIKFEVISRISQFDDRIQIMDVITEWFNDKKGYRVSVFLKKNDKETAVKIDITENVGFSLGEA